MVSRERIKNAAVEMAIETGYMPECEHIWSVQEHDNHPACFGQGTECDNRLCRWRIQCNAINQYATRNNKSGYLLLNLDSTLS